MPKTLKRVGLFKSIIQMKNQKPFFAKFLENQISENETAHVKGGDCIPEVSMTSKYPSDIEDSGPVITLKFPSDVEDNIDPITVTLKAPSDCEDC